MTSSGSSKELAKALNAFFQAPSVPLPTEILTIISAYLEKHNKFEEGASDRLNDELVSLYDKTVQDHPAKYAAFLAILRELRPAIHTTRRLFEWWNKLIDPVLEYVDREKGLAREVLDHTLDLLSLDESNGPATWNEAGLAPFIDRLLSRWMEVKESQETAKSSIIELKERMINEALLIFGKKNPKCFMIALNGFLVKKDFRDNSLHLLCDFVASQPPHLHLILQTPLFPSILHSLQKDESTSTVNTAVLALIMILPFMPSSLVPYLSTLFNVYARLLFWDRDSLFAQEHTGFDIEPEDVGGGVTWEKTLLDPDHDAHSIHYLPGYFTILYGLYPINFVDYIRKPQRYLRHASSAEDIDVQATEIRARSERFREKHRLHPNFYNLTIESEKSDLSRWIKSEGAEVLADCLALCIPDQDEPEEAQELSEFPGVLKGSSIHEEADKDGLDNPLLSSSVFVETPLLRNSSSVNLAQQVNPTGLAYGGRESLRSGHSQSSHPSGRESLDSKPREVGGDSPTLPPHLIQSSSHTQLQDMISSNKTMKTGLNQSLANDSVPSLNLGSQVSTAEYGLLQRPRLQTPRGSGESGNDTGDQVSTLYHQSLLLLNDLQFERYVKQQHITHMGALRRKQIREAATEAETQNLVMANRSLKQRLDEAKRQEGQIKKEFDHRRNMAQKRENDISAKLRTLREEQKKWNTEGTALKLELEQAQAECARLHKIIGEAEGKRLRSEQDLEAVDMNTDEIERLKAEIARLSSVEHEYQGKELKMERAMKAAEAAESRAEQWKADLTAHDEQLRQARKHYENQISDLNNKLSEALRDSQGGRASEITAMYENALAASRAKQTELQKQYSALMRKYTVLQSSLLDLQCDMSEKRTIEGGSSSYGAAGDAEMVAMSGNPIAIRNRGHRGFSDPEAFEGISHNATSPLEPVTGSLGSRRPSTPLDSADKPGTSTSPQIERYFGRGGVQNAVRKDKKEEKPEKKDKKEKKSGAGLRGIRF
ncbi:Hamartin protein-domain-containing protein [Cercophora newfieldiana]|uniref:Hamartin protein-domain-containing protein n=1 Tax=Cercophora newfieldiana TaxID=92897 RepID=A0AA40CN79_9PEZI|nr:Hamartin protein-domain-containing protein [Cercophora newfieldiana]